MKEYNILGPKMALSNYHKQYKSAVQRLRIQVKIKKSKNISLIKKLHKRVTATSKNQYLIGQAESPLPKYKKFM